MIARLARVLMAFALVVVAAGPAAACRAPAPVAMPEMTVMAECHGTGESAPAPETDGASDCCTAMCAGIAASAGRTPTGIAPVPLARTVTVATLVGTTPEMERPPPRTAA